MADVNLSAGVDTTEAEAELKDFARDGARALQGIESSFKTLGAAAAGALAFFAGREVVQGINAVVDAAKVQEDAVNSLNTALKLAGDFSQEASEDIQNFASGLQQVTTVGDETTLQLFALAKNFSLSNERTKELTEAAIQLSAATGIELESAVRNLGKTTAGLAGELGESIPQIRELSAEALKSGAAIDLVLQRFGGAAQAQVRTFSGATTQLSNAFGDLQEEIGFVITQNPQLIAAINEVSRIIGELTESVADNREGFSENFGAIIEFIASFATSAVSAFTSVRSIINDAILGYRIFAEGVIRALNAPFRAFSEFEAFTNEVFADIIDNAIGFVVDLIDVLKKVPGIETFLPQVETAQRDLQEFADTLGAGFSEAADEARKASAPLEDIEKAATRATAEQILANQEYEESANALVQSLADAEIRIAMAGDATEEFGAKSESATRKASEGIQSVSKEAQDAAQKQQESFAKLIEEIEKVERQAKPLEDQLAELGVAFAASFEAGAFEDARNIFIEIQGINKKITEEIENQAKAQREAQEAAIKRAQEEQRAAQQATEQAAQQILGVAVGGDGTAQLEIEELEQEIENLKNNLNSAALTTEQRQNTEAQLIEKEEALAAANARNLENSRKLVSSVAGVVGEVLLPGFGGIIGQLTDTLSQGPEQAAAFITGLVEGIPTIIENLALATPEIALALAETMPTVAARLAVELPLKVTRAFVQRVPEIIEAQVKEAPRLAAAFAEAIGQQIFSLDFDLTDFGNELLAKAQNFGQEIVNGAGNFIQKLIDEITGAIPGVGGDGDRTFAERVGIGGTAGDILDRAGSFFGLQGGTAFAQNATQFDALQRLSESQSERDEALIAGFTEAISNELRDAFARDTRPLVVNLEVGQAQLASVLLTLNRNGFRVA